MKNCPTSLQAGCFGRCCSLSVAAGSDVEQSCQANGISTDPTAICTFILHPNFTQLGGRVWIKTSLCHCWGNLEPKWHPSSGTSCQFENVPFSCRATAATDGWRIVQHPCKLVVLVGAAACLRLLVQIWNKAARPMAYPLTQQPSAHSSSTQTSPNWAGGCESKTSLCHCWGNLEPKWHPSSGTSCQFENAPFSCRATAATDGWRMVQLPTPQLALVVMVGAAACLCLLVQPWNKAVRPVAYPLTQQPSAHSSSLRLRRCYAFLARYLRAVFNRKLIIWSLNCSSSSHKPSSAWMMGHKGRPWSCNEPLCPVGLHQMGGTWCSHWISIPEVGPSCWALRVRPSSRP